MKVIIVMIVAFLEFIIAVNNNDIMTRDSQATRLMVVWN